MPAVAAVVAFATLPVILAPAIALSPEPLPVKTPVLAVIFAAVMFPFTPTLPVTIAPTLDTTITFDVPATDIAILPLGIAITTFDWSFDIPEALDIAAEDQNRSAVPSVTKNCPGLPPVILILLLLPRLEFPVTVNVLIVATVPLTVIVLDQLLVPSTVETNRLPLLEGTPRSGSAFCKSNHEYLLGSAFADGVFLIFPLINLVIAIILFLKCLQ